jgi:hypothetical protein
VDWGCYGGAERQLRNAQCESSTCKLFPSVLDCYGSASGFFAARRRRSTQRQSERNQAGAPQEAEPELINLLRAHFYRAGMDWNR